MDEQTYLVLSEQMILRLNYYIRTRYNLYGILHGFFRKLIIYVGMKLNTTFITNHRVTKITLEIYKMKTLPGQRKDNSVMGVGEWSLSIS